MATVLVGIKSGKSKKGNDYTMIHIMQDYTDIDKANGACGCSVDTVFLPDALVGQISPKDVGKKINLGYSVYGGRASICSIDVLEK